MVTRGVIAAAGSRSPGVSSSAATHAQIRAVLRYAAMLAEQTLDATFAALWADPERNLTEAERDRRTDTAIDAGAGFRGSIDDLLVTVDD
jgi:hypothetical protein